MLVNTLQNQHVTTEIMDSFQVISATIEPLADVSLINYNVTEFSLLVSNVTYNLTIAQREIVMTNGYNLVKIVSVTLRAVIVFLFDVPLILCILLLRNYEPIKSKLFVSLCLAGINIISHIQGLIDYLPTMRMCFESYWNQFLLEKSTKGIDAVTFYQNNLSANGIPTWMENYILFENVYTFISGYVLYGLVIISVALYSVQMIKLMLLTLLKDKRQAIVKSLEEFKEKQLEKWRNIKLQAINKDQQQQGGDNRKSLKKPGESTDDLNSVQLSDNLSTNTQSNAPLNLNLDLSTISSQQSMSYETPSKSLSARGSRPSELDENPLSSMDYDDIALDMTTDDDAISTSYDDISKKGKFVNLLKKIIKYRVVEMIYVFFWTIVWLVIVSVTIAFHAKDKWSSIFYSWDKYSGYGRTKDRDDMGAAALVVLFILFLSIPLFLAVDFVLAVIKYANVRKSNKEKGERTENFFIYYFYETDPFVYRIEGIFIVIFDIGSGVAYLIAFPSATFVSGQLAVSLILAFGLNFLGGSISNPGITAAKTLWNFFIAFKAKRKSSSDLNNQNDSNSIQTIHQLISSPSTPHSIDFIISHKKERELFYQYLREEYSVENLLFTEDLMKLRKMNDKHVKSKVMKIKEMTKLYLSEANSVFEINVPSKIIQSELKEYRELLSLLDENKVKVNQLPRIMKDTTMRYFPNIDLSKEEAIKPLIAHLCKPNIFTTLQTEVYKNLLDSLYRFNNSRKWKEYLRTIGDP